MSPQHHLMHTTTSDHTLLRFEDEESEDVKPRLHSIPFSYSFQISTLDGKIIHTKSDSDDDYVWQLVFHHSQDTCILAVRTRESLQVLFISPKQE